MLPGWSLPDFALQTAQAEDLPPDAFDDAGKIKACVKNSLEFPYLDVPGS